jgi:hypothetical protein
MKKNTTAPWISSALLALLVLTGASVWEGSAAVSVAGELPEGAYYVATNSFPRNTVVDVTNLENGRTIRVIVAAGLDSPGLLAMLSRNAATAIGAPIRGIGRVRMTAPSDPITFSRFTEENGLSGSPDSPGSGVVVSSALRTATVGDLAAATPEDRFYSAIVNQPESYTPPATAYPQDGSVHKEPQPAWLVEEPASPPDIAETPYPETPPLWSDPPLVVVVPAPEPGQPQPMLAAPATPSQQPYYPNTSLSSTPYAWQNSSPYLAPSGEAPALPPNSALTLTPAEERPPASSERELLPIPPPPRQAGTGGDDTQLDPRYFIGPIPQPARPSQSPARILYTPSPAPAVASAPAPAVAVSPPARVPAATGSIFSVPIITVLERGKQYVQIGAFSRPDTLETAVAHACMGYPLVIETGGANNTLVYRLLIGPLNVGEGAATLRRIKISGFPDAFIRK